jgi:hypothetical protein
MTLSIRNPAGRGRWASERLRVVAVAVVMAIGVAACGSPSFAAPAASDVAIGPAGSAAPAASTQPAGETPSASPSAESSASPSPSPTPVPTPVLAVAPLTGRLVKPALATRHPIAVMVDDHWAARPQSGFTEASVVWQAPAEGGIPRYMMIFAEGNPTSVGPVRSARVYFVQWAAEWKAAFVHVGGSPQAMALLRAKGRGELVYDADQYRWGAYLWRTKDRVSPHNVYTDGKRLRALAAKVGAAPLEGARPVWVFRPDAALERRPSGARVDVAYSYGAFSYRYDRPSNTWRRFVNGKLQKDRASGAIVAPKNVVVMEVAFGSLGAGQKGRLEAANIGSGRAWIATNGVVTRGTWKKTSAASPTRFFDGAGKAVALTAGQTFVQVMPVGSPIKVVKGTPVATPSPSPVVSPGASGSPDPSAPATTLPTATPAP